MKIRIIMKSRSLTQFNWGSFSKIAILLNLAIISSKNKNKKVVKNKSSFNFRKTGVGGISYNLFHES